MMYKGFSVNRGIKIHSKGNHCVEFEKEKSTFFDGSYNIDDKAIYVEPGSIKIRSELIDNYNIKF